MYYFDNLIDTIWYIYVHNVYIYIFLGMHQLSQWLTVSRYVLEDKDSGQKGKYFYLILPSNNKLCIVRYITTAMAAIILTLCFKFFVVDLKYYLPLLLTWESIWLKKVKRIIYRIDYITPYKFVSLNKIDVRYQSKLTHCVHKFMHITCIHSSFLYLLTGGIKRKTLCS